MRIRTASGFFINEFYFHLAIPDKAKPGINSLHGWKTVVKMDFPNWQDMIHYLSQEIVFPDFILMSMNKEKLLRIKNSLPEGQKFTRGKEFVHRNSHLLKNVIKAIYYEYWDLP